MSEGNAYRIVVGVDGSPASRSALRWALWQAHLTHGSITALMAWDFPAIYNWEPAPPEDFTHAAAKALGEVIDDSTAGDTSIPIHKEVAQGSPARALLDASKDADLLVVGSRGHGGFAGALLGSVSQHCTQHASCPVVVVREHKH